MYLLYIYLTHGYDYEQTINKVLKTSIFIRKIVIFQQKKFNKLIFKRFAIIFNDFVVYSNPLYNMYIYLFYTIYVINEFYGFGLINKKKEESL